MPYPDRSGAVATKEATQEIIAMMEAHLKASIKVTIASLVIASTALLIASESLYFSYQDANDDGLWKQELINVLKQISQQLKVQVAT